MSEYVFHSIVVRDDETYEASDLLAPPTVLDYSQSGDHGYVRLVWLIPTSVYTDPDGLLVKEFELPRVVQPSE